MAYSDAIGFISISVILQEGWVLEIIMEKGPTPANIFNNFSLGWTRLATLNLSLDNRGEKYTLDTSIRNLQPDSL